MTLSVLPDASSRCMNCGGGGGGALFYRHQLSVHLSVTAQLLLLALLVVVVPGSSYNHRPCNRRRSIRSQFQFPDCYVPPLDTSLLLSRASFVLSHDSATGYIRRSDLKSYPKGKVGASYSKNQVGSVYDQLNDGARALDVRPKLLLSSSSGDGGDGSGTTVVLQHGDMDITWVTLEMLVADAVRWCRDNPDELVLILHSELRYDSMPRYDEGSALWVTAASAVYEKLGVPYVQCQDVAGLTVGETMELAKLSSSGEDEEGGRGGYLLAMDRQDYYGSFCGKSNWLGSDNGGVTCYPKRDYTKDVFDSKQRCTTGSQSVPMRSLKEYVVACANNDPTYDYPTVGPPADTDYYPFNEIQALWQVDVRSALNGMARGSTLLDDNRRSDVNAEMVDLIYSGALNDDAVGLFAVDNVALNGNALLSVLRTRCGQFSMEELQEGGMEIKCGRELDKPRVRRHHRLFEEATLASIILAVGAFCIWGGYRVWKKRRIMMASMCRRRRLLSEKVGNGVGSPGVDIDGRYVLTE